MGNTRAGLRKLAKNRLFDELEAAFAYIRARREITDVLNELKIPYTMDLQSGVRMLKRVWEYARHLQARNVDPDVFRRTAAR